MIEQVAVLDLKGRALLLEVANARKMSARGFHRILKLARTLADMDGVDRVERVHVAEAISYRIAGESMADAA